MTVILRTDHIVNLYPNAIADISKDSPAVVTVPVTEQVVSATGTIGTVTGSGPWLATITNMTTTAGLKTGDVITATPDVGEFGAGGEVSVNAIVGPTSIQIKKIGGTTPTAGAIQYISLPAVGTLPAFRASGDPIQITGLNKQLTADAQAVTTTGAFQVGETITQPIASAISLTGVTGVATTVVLSYATQGSAPFTPGDKIIVSGVSLSGYNGLFTVTSSTTTQTTYELIRAGSFGTAGAGGTVVKVAVGTVVSTVPSVVNKVNDVVYGFVNGTVNFTPVSGTFDTTHVVTGQNSKATMIPTSVTGMTELLTAGLSNGNTFYIDVLTDNTFALYKNAELTSEVDSSAFTTAIANAGQYTTIDTVVIQVPDE